MKYAFKITTIFWALIGVFVMIISDMIIPQLIPTLRSFMIPIMFISWIAFFLLGLALVVFIVKKKVSGLQGWLKRFLLLTGSSAVGFFVFVILHNAVYALFKVEEHFFFILAVIVCPLGFLVGAIGTIVIFFKKRKRE